MTTHEPNYDMLTAHADGALSPDAARSMEQHLQQCEVCAEAFERERVYVTDLDRLADVEPPPDFVNAVMGRVAQYPAHRPTSPIPWRSAMRWSVAASVLLLVLIGSGVAWMIGSGTLQPAEPGAMAATGISRTTQMATTAITSVRDVASPALVLLEKSGRLVWQLAAATTSSGWIVQLTLLLLTVSLNYVFTRMVLSYQRRN